MVRTASDREHRRVEGLERFAVEEARRDFSSRYGAVKLPPVVALICAYDEVDNIGDVLKAVPDQAGGLPVASLVIVDGGKDDTAKVSVANGAMTCVLPTNLGHGVALRVGYRLSLDGGARYVVTLDADGQNDPAELPVMLQPLLDDTADFVVASRRLGVDQTSDQVRRTGVVVFAWLMNRLTGSTLTDTSNGYRALKSELLADVVDRLEQRQYQTAELLITAISRGWRVTERPTVWRPRASGSSKKGSNLFFGLRYASVVARTWLRERHDRLPQRAASS
ncbi:MAG: glycosyltransferase family 2 protein [Acidimicrobiales bacterium]